MSVRLLLLVVGLVATPVACGGGQLEAVIEEDVVYATWGDDARAYESWEDRDLTLDLHAPARADGETVVVYLPGRGERRAPKLLVNSLVEEGAIVLVVRYARSKAGPETDLSDHGSVARAKADSVGCAIRYGLQRALDHGNSDPVVVLTGFSNGAGLAAHTALFGATLEASWDEYTSAGGPPRQVECEVAEGSTHVDGLVAMAGPYDVWVPIYDGAWGRAYQQEHDPALWEFLSSSIGANPNLSVRLIHGTADEVIPYENSVPFAVALTGAGHDVGDVIRFEDGGHFAPSELALPAILDVIGP